MSSALAGRFLTTEPSGKSSKALVFLTPSLEPVFHKNCWQYLLSKFTEEKSFQTTPSEIEKEVNCSCKSDFGYKLGRPSELREGEANSLENTFYDKDTSKIYVPPLK